MPGPLERWLETFMCGQFAEHFERYGYRTLQTVCQLQLPQLLSIGIPQKESEIILQNIQILCQSTATVAQQQTQLGMRSNYGNRMSQEVHGTSFQDRDTLQQHMNYMVPDSSCYNYGSPSSGVGGHFYSQCMPQPPDPMMNSVYRQQQYQGSSFPVQQPPDRAQYPNTSMTSTSNAVVTSRHNYPGHVPGAPLIGQTNMHQSHPHLRNSGQTPQEVANNILHMAAASYPTNHTVQVPLSKNRSAPYHVPSRSPNYNTQLQENQQMCSDYSQGQFVYPSPPHQSQQHQSRDPRLSPISPASASMMSSPRSHHSGRSIPSSSPCSLHSPGIGHVRSPCPNSQMMNSPQRGQYPMSSSLNPPSQRLMSPVPTNQQLQVSVPSSISQPFQHCYLGNMLNSSQHPPYQQQFISQFSPTALAQNSQYGQVSQFCNPSGVPTGHFGHSPGDQSGHFSNISSPYTPGSRTYPSPPQTQDSPHSVSDTNLTHTSDIKECNSPLESLQKLCMLPESQVVDPKTVVKEACIASPSNLVVKTFESCSNSSDFISAKTTTASTGISSVSESVSSRKDNELSKGTFESVVSPEMKFQPKKMMLLRAAKEDFCSTSQGDACVQSGCGQPEAGQDTENNTDQQTESEQDAAKNETHVTEGSVVETISDDRIISDNICPENSDDVIPTDSSINQKESNDQSSAYLYYDGSVKDSSSEHADHNTSNDLTLDVVDNFVQDINTAQSSSQNTEECHADFKAAAGIIDPVQSPVRDAEEKVQSKDVQVAYVSDSSVSDNEPQLVVRKDTKNTYSKQERLKSFEITPRIRADSTGSLSESSEFEYEDHIGCDDIETGFTDIDEKANEVIEESVDDTKDLSSNISDGSMVIDRVMINGSHWKKNGVNNKARKNRKNGHLTPIHVIRQVSELDLDYVPSPLGGDVVDGPVGVDNGDGTVTVSRPSRMRQRKTPIKYKDTSFFQGDFVFIEEEEDYLHQMEPKKKVAKRTVDISCHDTNKNGIVKTSDKMSKSTEKHTANNKLLKEKKPKQIMKPKSQKLETPISKHLQNTSTPPTETAKQNCEQMDSECKITNMKLTKGDNGHMKRVKMVSVPDSLNLDECVKDNTTKPEVPSISPIPKSKSDSKATPSQILIDKAAVTTRNASSKEEVSVEKSGSIKNTVAKRQLNGVKTRSINCGVKAKNNRTGKSSAVVSQNKGKLAEASKSKTIIAEETNSDDNYEVIEINSEDSNGADNVSGANNNDEKSKKARLSMAEVGSLAMECEDIVSDEEQSQRRGFMFSLVEDEIVDENIIVAGAETDLTGDLIEIDDQTEIDDETKTSIKGHTIKRPSPASNIKGKNACTKISKVKNSGKSSKRKSFIEDPDLGPSKKSLKSSKLDSDILSTRKSNKKPDKWANFKGPKVIFDGVKDTPNNCLVINDPFEQQTISKRAKLTSQNVTRIEISQLPSDKSVLIPYTETSESDEWTCALCGKHSSYKFLGDLFGPYTVETMSEDMLDLIPKVWLGTKKRRSDEGQIGMNKGCRSGKRSGSIIREVNEWKEVWVHESCSVYSDGVFLIGSKIYGLQEAVRIASQTPCSLCHKLGAMIGCLNKGCQQKFHHVCAQEADCYLDEENFSLLCPKHKIKKLKQLEACISTNVASTSTSID